MVYSIKCDGLQLLSLYQMTLLFHCALRSEAEKGLFIFPRSLCNYLASACFYTMTIGDTGAPSRNEMFTLDLRQFHC